MFKKIDYAQLNARQKENYNFQKVASRLANYGFNCLRLSDDWEGADFIACHIDGSTILKVQLKGRLTFDKKYEEKQIHIAFRYSETIYLYPHDELLDKVRDLNTIVVRSDSWNVKEHYNSGKLSVKLKELLEDYKLT